MARRIDSILAWSLIVFSIFYWMMVCTESNIPLSALLTFGIVFLLRRLFGHLPHKQHIRKKERIAYIKYLLKKWALLPPMDALTDIRTHFPHLLSDVQNENIYFVQKMPDGEPLNTNQLLEIWHKHHHLNELFLLCTCSLDGDAAALISDLNAPAVQIMDSSTIITQLTPLIQEIPKEIKINERRASFAKHIARLIQNIHPARSGLYAVVFFILYLMGKSFVHLFAACILVLLTAIHLLIAYTQLRLR